MSPTIRRVFALVDCNNFYASCERLFRPELNGYRQQDLFSPVIPAKEDQPLMAALDKINGKWGRHTIQYGMTAETGKPWSMQQARKSPAYTTSWHELPVVKTES